MQMPHSDRKAMMVVSRASVAQGGFVYWIAFERDAYDGSDLHTDPSSLRGPSTKRCRVTRIRPSTNAGKVRVSAIASLASAEGDPHGGAASFSVVGSPHDISDVLRTWAFKPAANYYGRVVIDAAVVDGRNVTAYSGLTVVIKNEADAPSILFRGASVGVDGAGYDAYALAVDEDSEARFIGLAVGDVDAEPGEVHNVTLRASHGVLAVHQTATDARFGHEASYTETSRRGGGSGGREGPGGGDNGMRTPLPFK